MDISKGWHRYRKGGRCRFPPSHNVGIRFTSYRVCVTVHVHRYWLCVINICVLFMYIHTYIYMCDECGQGGMGVHVLLYTAQMKNSTTPDWAPYHCLLPTLLLNEHLWWYIWMVSLTVNRALSALYNKIKCLQRILSELQSICKISKKFFYKVSCCTVCSTASTYTNIHNTEGPWWIHSIMSKVDLLATCFLSCCLLVDS